MKDPAREAAFEIVSAVLQGGKPLDEAVEAAFANSALDARSRAFVRNLAATTFRRLGAINHVLDAYLERPLPVKARWVRVWLALGAAQILFLDVPDHAALDTTVSGIGRTRQPGAGGFKGLANAILRKTAKNRAAHVKEIEAKPSLNVPPWLFARWSNAFGQKTAEAFVRASLSPPPLDLCIKAPSDVAALAKALNAREVFSGILRLNAAGRIEELPGFREGRWWAMDVAASLPPRLFGNVGGKHVLDLCAAPGGKTLFLASQGASVTALDISKERLKRLRANLKRTRLSAKVLCTDALQYSPAAGFDMVLLDAPCSATGTLRRHPDVPWRRAEHDIARLARLQGKLLDRAFTFLKPGGMLIYCVCSLEPEEGADIVGAFLAATPAGRRLPLRAGDVEGHGEWITPEGDLRTLPCHMAEIGGMDGFFSARIERKAG